MSVCDWDINTYSFRRTSEREDPARLQGRTYGLPKEPISTAVTGEGVYIRRTLARPVQRRR